MSTQLFTGTKSILLNELPEEAWRIFGRDHSSERTDVQKHYRAVGVMYRCVQIRMNAIRRVPWAILQGDTPLWESGQEIPDSLLWARNLHKLIPLTEASLIFMCEAFWHKERNRSRLLDLRWFAPITMYPQWDKEKGLTGFERDLGFKKVILPVEDIVYFWAQSPMHETLPDVPAAQAAMSAAGVLYNVNTFVQGFFERGAIKATLLTVEGTPSQPEKDRLKAWWNRFFSGVTKSWGAEVVNAAVKPIVVGEGISELSNTDLTHERREEIATAMGIPHSMIFSEAANFATARVDKINFYGETVLPQCELIEIALNEQVFNELGYQFKFKPEQLDIYEEDESDRATAFQKYTQGGMKQSLAAQILGIELPDGMEYDELDPIVAEPELDAEGNPMAAGAKKDILGYHIEQGVVTQNEARADVGLPPIDETQGQKLRDLRAILEVMTVAKNAGVPIDQAAQLVGLGITIEKPEPPPIAQGQRPPQRSPQDEEQQPEQPPQRPEPDPAQVQEKRLADLDKWRRKAQKRLDGGKPALCEFESEWLSPLEVVYIKYKLEVAQTKEAIDRAFEPDIEEAFMNMLKPPESKGLRFVPRGTDEPLPPIPAQLDITDDDIEFAIAQWDNAFVDFAGMLEAEVADQGQAQ